MDLNNMHLYDQIQEDWYGRSKVYDEDEEQTEILCPMCGREMQKCFC